MHGISPTKLLRPPSIRRLCLSVYVLCCERKPPLPLMMMEWNEKSKSCIEFHSLFNSSSESNSLATRPFQWSKQSIYFLRISCIIQKQFDGRWRSIEIWMWDVGCECRARWSNLIFLNINNHKLIGKSSFACIIDARTPLTMNSFSRIQSSICRKRWIFVSFVRRFESWGE